MSAEGQILDNTYRLVRLVAEGGMGLVYEATHARLAGRYAIKVLPQRWSRDPDALARFDREARITSSLQHPNIVQIVDFNTAADGTEYLVMEYLCGETLAARLTRLGPMPLDSVVTIVEQVASGLAAAHAHGIVHRDLKPENVLLVDVEGREGDWAKILDFGISKVTDASLDTIGPASKSVIGTPQYMAPEQCEGRTKDVGAATDQFALAVITYEMLMGRRPFEGDSIGDVLFRVLKTEAPPMTVDRGIESVVRRGLAKSSRDRYPSVTAFAEALRTAVLTRGHRSMGYGIEESGSHAYAAGELDRTKLGRPSRPGRWVAALAAAAVVTIATAFVVRARTRQPTAPELTIAAFQSPALALPADSADSPVLPQPTPRTIPEIEPLDEQPPVTQTVAASAPPARVAIVHATTAPPARTQTIAARKSVPLRRPTRQVSVSEPPLFRPLPPDEDAILPLNESFNDAP